MKTKFLYALLKGTRFGWAVLLAAVVTLSAIAPASAMRLDLIPSSSLGNPVAEPRLASLNQSQDVQAIIAATITVDTIDDEMNSDGNCSLFEAITAANTNAAVDACTSGTPGADTITFNITGTIIIVGYQPSASVLPSISEDLTLAGPGVANLTLTDDQTVSTLTSRLLVVDPGVTLNLQDLTVADTGGIRNSGTLIVTDSTFSGNISPTPESGGAIAGGTVIVENSTLSGNRLGDRVCSSGVLCGGGGAIDGNTVTVTNSTFSGNDAPAGGAIYANGTVTVANSTFSGNSAGSGGAIYINSLSSITDSIFTDNSVGDDGGAIFNGDSVTITDSTFTDNSAGNGGGAIFDDDQGFAVTGSTFTGNRAQHGGAIFGNATVGNSTFINNSAGNTGGAISCSFCWSGVAVGESTFTGNSADLGGAIRISGEENRLFVADSTFSGNSAQNGGAIQNGALGAHVTGSTFSDNSADLGGAISHRVGDVNIDNSTFSGNSAGSGGAVYNLSNLKVFNSTFSGNGATVDGDLILNLDPYGATTLYNTIMSGGNCFGTIMDGGNNLQSFNGTCGDTIPTANPRLGPLANNGGPTQTMALLSGSPAIDAGNPAGCAADNFGTILTTDQRGVVRPQDGNGNGIAICDIGAFEFEFTPLVLSLRSGGAQDGWALESSETSNKGGSIKATATTFLLGDTATRQQYRAILSFNTSSLPDDASITKVTLKIKKQSVTGTNPFTTHGKILVDIRRGAFSNVIPLQATDFQAAASRSGVGLIANNPQAGGWYVVNLKAIAYQYVNRTGVTQFRLRFQLDDDNDSVADLIRFFSGNSIAANRPVLVIEYYVP